MPKIPIPVHREWWSVHGSAYGPREFTDENEALIFYEEQKKHPYSTNVKLVHHQTVRTEHEDEQSETNLLEVEETSQDVRHNVFDKE